MQIPFTALNDVVVRASERVARSESLESGSRGLLEINPKANQPIEDKVELTREGRLQEQLLRGLNLRYSYQRTPAGITAETMNDVLAEWAKKGNLSLNDVKIMAVAYAYAADNGYDISNAINFETDYSFWAGVNKKTIGDGAASTADTTFAHIFIGSSAFETSRIPKDFLLMSFDPLHPTSKGEDARFVADFARYLSDVPEEDFDGDTRRAELLFKNYRKQMDL